MSKPSARAERTVSPDPAAPDPGATGREVHGQTGMCGSFMPRRHCSTSPGCGRHDAPTQAPGHGLRRPSGASTTGRNSCRRKQSTISYGIRPWNPNTGLVRRPARRSMEVCRSFADVSHGESVTLTSHSLGLCPPGRLGYRPLTTETLIPTDPLLVGLTAMMYPGHLGPGLTVGLTG